MYVLKYRRLKPVFITLKENETGFKDFLYQITNQNQIWYDKFI